MSKEKLPGGFWCPDPRFLEREPPEEEDLLTLPRAVVDPLVFPLGPKEKGKAELDAPGEKTRAPSRQEKSGKSPTVTVKEAAGEIVR